ncbi:MAG: CapA family protein [Actinobacteria bacterium]|nr:CapA family protein [Actinomycetota bacterium]
MKRPVAFGVVVPVAAALTATTLCGCFDGTVRTPTEAAKTVPGKREPTRQDQGHEHGDGISIAAVGDTMLGSTPELPPEPATYLDPVKGELSGDVVFGNLEGALTEVGESPKCVGAEPGQCYAFRAPPEYAKYLADAGFTLMSNANNHSYDFGEAGESETVEALHAAGIEQTGLPEEVTVVEANGHRVAFLAFAPYSNTSSLTDLESARALIESAAAEADVVVVAIHAGAEGADAQHVTGAGETYLGEDRGNPEEFAHLAVDAGADLVLGSGPHVLRGIELYKHRLLAYSLGNFCGFHNFATEGALGESVVLHVSLSPEGVFRSGRLASLRLVEAGQPVPDPSGEAAATIATLSAADFGSSAVEVGPGGRLLAGNS